MGIVDPRQGCDIDHLVDDAFDQPRGRASAIDVAQVVAVRIGDLFQAQSLALPTGTTARGSDDAETAATLLFLSLVGSTIREDR